MARALPLRLATIALVALLALCTGAVAVTWEQDAKRKIAIATIDRYAQDIIRRSGCVGAGCVRMACAQADATWRALSAALLLVNDYDAELLRWREFHAENPAGQRLNDLAQADRRRVDFVGEVQLLQDTISVVYLTASEIASSIDLYRTLAEDTAKWNQVFGGEKGPFEGFSKLKDVKSIVSRIDSFTKYPEIGKPKAQKITVQDIAKLSGEASQRFIELERKRRSGELTSADRRKAWLSQAKELADLALKLDRMSRQSFIAELQRDWRASSSVADEFATSMRRISDTRADTRNLVAKLNRAMVAFADCHRRGCVGIDGSVPALPTVVWSPPDLTKPLVVRLRALDKRLGKAQTDIVAAANAYAPVIDVTSSILFRVSRTSYRGFVSASYAVQRFRRGATTFRCIPENVRLIVFTGKGPMKEVMDAGPAPGDRGQARFKVQRSLAGAWQGPRAAVGVEISVINDKITLTRKDTPVVGRNRVYTGTLRRWFSEPGSYRLALVDTQERAYLATSFTVAGPPTLDDVTTQARSRPDNIADLGPRIPEDIRRKLLAPALRDRVRYRAVVTPVLHRDGAPTLKIELFNHRFSYYSKSREIVRSSIREHSEYRGPLKRAPD